MKVLQISTNELSGGAHTAANRLHRALAIQGVDSVMAVINKRSDDPRVIQVRPFPIVPRSLGNFFFRVARRLEHPVSCIDGGLFSSERTLYGRSLHDQLPSADIVNLHWIADMLDYKASLPLLTGRTPVVWTFHDMNAFTGGCHYTGGCSRFTGTCGSCPNLVQSGPEDLSAKIYRRKADALSRVATERLHIVCPSQWLASEVRRSSLFSRFDTRVIPYGLDTEEFSPVDKATARRQLGLGADATIVLFAAERLRDPRKGAELLLEAVKKISDIPRLQICAIGTPYGAPEMPAPLFRQLGSVEGNRKLAAVFSAADVFVIPSRQDNLPNTVLEAMACGTPVVGFDVGGIPDLVAHGRTGYLAEAGSSASLAEQLRLILGDDARRRCMGEEARRVVLERYTLRHQAAAYLDLYHALLGRDAAPLTGLDEAGRGRDLVRITRS